MIGLFIAGLLILPFLDLYLLVQIAGSIGLLETVGVIALTGILGLAVIRREGLYVLFKLSNSVTAGELSRNAAEIGMLLAGGLLLLFPGFVTDGLGFMFILRPIRERLAARLSGSLEGNARIEIERF